MVTTKPPKSDLIKLLFMITFVKKSTNMTHQLIIKWLLQLTGSAIIIFGYTSCVRNEIVHNIELENVILNECELINQNLVKDFKYDKSKSEYVNSCGCVSGIISEAMIDQLSYKRIESIVKKEDMLKRYVNKYMVLKKAQIQESCVN